MPSDSQGPGEKPVEGLVIAPVPDWSQLPNLGIPDMEDMTGKDVFGAYLNGEGVGLIILRYHYGDTADICWLGVHPHHHNKGIGTALMARALEQALARNCTHAVCTILAGHDDGLHPDSRHRLMTRHGFRPFFKYNEKDAVHATMLMMRTL
jgi:GNAT superfamily N-acetyltransferase